MAFIMNKSVISLFIVLIISATVTQSKPQGCSACGSSHEELAEKCCNKCELCRTSFDVEAPPSPIGQKCKTYSYNVERNETPCYVEPYQTHDVEFEAPCDPEYPTCSRQHFRVERPPRPSYREYLDTFDFEVIAPPTGPQCKELRLSASVDHVPRDCECDYCRYGQYRNSSFTNNETYSLHENFITCNRTLANRLKQSNLKSAIAKRFREEFNISNNFTVIPLPKTIHKRSFDNHLVKEGYVCRCVPANESESLFQSEITPTTRTPLLRRLLTNANILPDIYIGDSVFVGGDNPPSYEMIKNYLSGVTLSRAVATEQLFVELAEIYYEIYKISPQRNYSIPLKYGTKETHVNNFGLRTYDIQPVDGKYQPSAFNSFVSYSNQFFGKFMDTEKASTKLLNKLRNISTKHRRLFNRLTGSNAE